MEFIVLSAFLSQWGDELGFVLSSIFTVAVCVMAWTYRKRNGTSDKAHKQINDKIDKLYEIVNKIYTDLAAGKEKMEALEKGQERHEKDIRELRSRD